MIKIFCLTNVNLIILPVINRIDIIHAFIIAALPPPVGGELQGNLKNVLIISDYPLFRVL